MPQSERRALVVGGGTMGIGIMTRERWQKTRDFLVELGVAALADVAERPVVTSVLS